MTNTLLILLLALPRVDHDPGVRIAEAATTLLASRYPDVAHRLSVRVIRASGSIDAESPVRLSWAEALEIPKGYVQAQVEQQVGTEQWEMAGRATLYISHFDSVAVSLKSFGPDEPVQPSDFQFAWIETTKFRGRPLTTAQFAIMETQGSMFTDRFLRPDRALRVSDLRPAYAAETGQSVTMAYSRAGISLTLLTKARRPGFEGDVIKLFSSVTNKTYRARLTAPGEAEWIETLN